jgi:hypothetical protein
VVYDFIGDKWPKSKRKAGLEATVASMLAKVINQVLLQKEAEKTEVGGFVTTRLAEAIFAIAQYAMKRRTIAVFVVSAGNGKTMALNALEIDTPGAVLITVQRTRSTVKSFLQLWARGLNLSENGRAEDIQDRIVSVLDRSNRLILIDEAHKMTVAALDVLREVWDKTRVSIVLAGTPSLYETMTSRRVGTHQHEIMDQLFSRVGMYRDMTELENPETGTPERVSTIADVRKIFARGQVSLARDAASFLCKLANTPGEGGLRTCAGLVQLVVDLWPGEQVTAALLRNAMGTRMGTKEASFRMDAAEITREEVAKTG